MLRHCTCLQEWYVCSWQSKKDRKVPLQTVVVKYCIVNVTACDRIVKFHTCSHGRMQTTRTMRRTMRMMGTRRNRSAPAPECRFFVPSICSTFWKCGWADLLQGFETALTLLLVTNRHEKPRISLLQHQVNIVTRPSNLLKNSLWSLGLNPQKRFYV